MYDCLIIGHRGASGIAPENTLLSYQTAIEIGVDMFELDVHQTSDGHLVCIHDYEVDRTTNGSGLVAEMSLNEIQKLDAGQGEYVPLLSEVLDLAFNRVMINIELKVPDVEREVIDLVKQKHMNDQIIISSFLHGTLQKISDIDRKIKTAVLVHTLFDDIIDYVVDLRAVALNPLHYLVTPELVSEAHHENLGIYPWTVNEPGFMIHLARLGVNGIITDFPNVAFDKLKK